MKLWKLNGVLLLLAGVLLVAGCDENDEVTPLDETQQMGEQEYYVEPVEDDIEDDIDVEAGDLELTDPTDTTDPLTDSPDPLTDSPDLLTEEPADTEQPEIPEPADIEETDTEETEAPDQAAEADQDDVDADADVVEEVEAE